MKCKPKLKLGFYVLGQALSMATFGSQTHTEVTVCDKMQTLKYRVRNLKFTTCENTNKINGLW